MGFLKKFFRNVFHEETQGVSTGSSSPLSATRLRFPRKNLKRLPPPLAMSHCLVYSEKKIRS